jgi:hypothetical protein
MSSLMDGIVEVAIASACADVQVYRRNVLLRVKKSMGIRQLPRQASHSMNLSG